MKLPALMAASVAVAVAIPGAVQAQMTLDVSKITCQQYVQHKVGNPRTLAAWLSGYFHGTRKESDR